MQYVLDPTRGLRPAAAIAAGGATVGACYPSSELRLPLLRGERGGGGSPSTADGWRDADRSSDHPFNHQEVLRLMPLYRQVQMLAREGIAVDRSAT